MDRTVQPFIEATRQASAALVTARQQAQQLDKAVTRAEKEMNDTAKRAALELTLMCDDLFAMRKIALHLCEYTKTSGMWDAARERAARLAVDQSRSLTDRRI